MLLNHNQMHITLTTKSKEKYKYQAFILYVSACRDFSLGYCSDCTTSTLFLDVDPLYWRSCSNLGKLSSDAYRTSVSVKENNWDPMNRCKHSSSKSLRDQYSLGYVSFSNHFRLLSHSSMFLWVLEYLWAL